MARTCRRAPRCATRARGSHGRGYNVKKIFAKIVDVKPNEVRALWLGFIFFFVVEEHSMRWRFKIVELTVPSARDKREGKAESQQERRRQ